MKKRKILAIILIIILVPVFKVLSLLNSDALALLDDSIEAEEIINTWNPITIGAPEQQSGYIEIIGTGIDENGTVTTRDFRINPYNMYYKVSGIVVYIAMFMPLEYILPNTNYLFYNPGQPHLLELTYPYAGLVSSFPIDNTIEYIYKPVTVDSFGNVTPNYMLLYAIDTTASGLAKNAFSMLALDLKNNNPPWDQALAGTVNITIKGNYYLTTTTRSENLSATTAAGILEILGKVKEISNSLDNISDSISKSNSLTEEELAQLEEANEKLDSIEKAIPKVTEEIKQAIEVQTEKLTAELELINEKLSNSEGDNSIGITGNILTSFLSLSFAQTFLILPCFIFVCYAVYRKAGD